MSKFLIIGDSHFNGQDMIRALEHLQDDHERVVHVGDFGYFPRDERSRQFVKTTQAEMKDHGKTMYVVPGNHEDHDSIDALIASNERDEDGFLVITDNIRMVPRSLSWRWGIYNFSAIGGAHSIDKHIRTPGVDWFAQEQPRFGDLDSLSAPCNVLFTHDAPFNIARKLGWRELDSSNHGIRSQRVLAAACDLLRPTHLVHGHWHRLLKYKFPLDNASVRCLGLSHIHGSIYDGLAEFRDGGIRSLAGNLNESF